MSEYLNPPNGAGKIPKLSGRPGSVKLSLPFPPSINHYWRARGMRRFISKAGVIFRDTVIATVRPDRSLTGRLKVRILAVLPDCRVRDLDNISKPVLDALEYAKVYENDNQIDDLHIVRGPVHSPGSLEIVIEEIEQSAGCVLAGE